MPGELKNNQSLRNRALSGMTWKLLEKAGMQTVQFVVQIVLARLVTPAEYGLVGLLTIFIAVSEPFITQGFTTALIQKKETDEIDFSSVYWANIFLGFAIYGVLFAASPLISLFYQQEQLTALMRVLSINIIAGAFCAVHNAVLVKNLDFKKSFFRNLFNIGTQAVVGIVLALIGMGPWALVFSKVTGTVVGSIVLNITIKWKPIKVFSRERLWNLFGYSSKVFATNELNVVFNNISSLVIGKYYSSEDLGFYQRGQQMPQMIMNAIDGSFNEVLYPTLSSIQDDLQHLKNVLRRSLKTSMFIVLPLMMGLMATSDTLVSVLLTGKWLPCVPFLRLQCIICAFWPLSASINALNAIGKSGVTLKISIIGKILTIGFLIIGLRFGVYAIMISTLCAELLSIRIVSIYTKKYINYSLFEMIEDMFKSLLCSLLMGGIVIFVGLVPINALLKLMAQIIVGVCVYLAFSKILKNESYSYVLDIIKTYVKRIKRY